MEGKTRRVVDVNQAPVIFADVILSAEIVGDNVRVTFGEHATVDGEPIAMPVVIVVRPLKSCLELTLQDMLRRQLERVGVDQHAAMH